VYDFLGPIEIQYLEQSVGLRGSTYRLLQYMRLYTRKSYTDKLPNIQNIEGDNMVQRLFYTTVHPI
jgi:hypothetical protein